MKKTKPYQTIFLLVVLFSGVIIAAITIPKAIATTDNHTSPIFILNDEDNEEDEDDDGIGDDEENENKRAISIEVQTREAHIESSFESGEIENEIQIEIHEEDEVLKIQYEFSTEIGDNESELEFSASFYTIIEYIDENNNTLFDIENDTIVQTYTIGPFQPIVYKFINSTQGNLYSFKSTTNDGVFTAMVFVSNEFLKVNETVITPTEAKIDIIIENFPYVENDSALALGVKLQAEVEIEYDNETEDESYERATDEAELEVNMTDYLGFFSWNEKALVDDIKQPVVISYHNESSQNERKIFLNYYRGTTIIHDPKVGITGILLLETTNPFIFPLFTIGGLTILAIIAFGIIGLRKIRSRKVS